MNFQELIARARFYTRDNDSMLFDEETIKSLINEGIDRVRQYNVFKGMTKLSAPENIPALLPDNYHYILALFASSRMFDADERFHEGTEKRNEFEYALGTLIDDIQSGTIVITDSLGNVVTDKTVAKEYVTDEYFNVNVSDTEEVII